MSKITTKKGSALLFTTIIMVGIVTIGAAMFMIGMGEKKSAIVTDDSAQAIQIADAMSRKVRKAIIAERFSETKTLQDLAQNLAVGSQTLSCSVSSSKAYIPVTISSADQESYEVYFYIDLAAQPPTLASICETTLSGIKRIKVVGIKKNSARAIEIDIPEKKMVFAVGPTSLKPVDFAIPDSPVVGGGVSIENSANLSCTGAKDQFFAGVADPFNPQYAYILCANNKDTNLYLNALDLATGKNIGHSDLSRLMASYLTPHDIATDGQYVFVSGYQEKKVLAFKIKSNTHNIDSLSLKSFSLPESSRPLAMAAADKSGVVYVSSVPDEKVYVLKVQENDIIALQQPFQMEAREISGVSKARPVSLRIFGDKLFILGSIQASAGSGGISQFASATRIEAWDISSSDGSVSFGNGARVCSDADCNSGGVLYQANPDQSYSSLFTFISGTRAVFWSPLNTGATLTEIDLANSSGWDYSTRVVYPESASSSSTLSMNMQNVYSNGKSNMAFARDISSPSCYLYYYDARTRNKGRVDLGSFNMQSLITP